MQYSVRVSNTCAIGRSVYEYFKPRERRRVSMLQILRSEIKVRRSFGLKHDLVIPIDFSLNAKAFALLEVKVDLLCSERAKYLDRVFAVIYLPYC